MWSTTKLRMLGVVAGVAGGGCASIPRPTNELAQSEGALRSAQELGAGQIPQAALEVKLAQDELEQAREQMKGDHNEAARQSLLRSQADSELALALTRQGKADSDARQAQEELRTVQKNVQQNQ